MKTIYLAGKVGGRKWNVVPQHPYVNYVASDGGNHSEHEWSINVGVKPLNHPMMAEAVQERCIDVLKTADALFAYLDSPYSYGSIAEIAYASALGIPCMVVVNFDCDTSPDEADEWANGTMSDAYWFVSNFPGVSSFGTGTEEKATELFTRYLGYVLAESPIERQLWSAFLSFVHTEDDKAPGLPVAQYQLNGYRLDFAWPGYQVVVEVDGHDYHKTKEQRSYDAKRDRELTKFGWTTLRFTGSDVYKDAEAVADEVFQILLADIGV